MSPDGLDADSGRLDPEQAWRFAAFDTPPELLFGREQEVLVEGIDRDGDFDPFPASGDDREDRHLGVRDPHVVLKLSHMLFDRALLGKRPGQHELGFEDGPCLGHHPVEGRAHPSDHRMPDPALDIPEDLLGVPLEPIPVEGLGHDSQLDDEVAGEVFGFNFAPLFPPEPK